MSKTLVLLTNSRVNNKINNKDNNKDNNLSRWKQHLIKNNIVISADDIYHWPALFISPYADSADKICNLLEKFMNLFDINKSSEFSEFSEFSESGENRLVGNNSISKVACVWSSPASIDLFMSLLKSLGDKYKNIINWLSKQALYIPGEGSRKTLAKYGLSASVGLESSMEGVSSKITQDNLLFNPVLFFHGQQTKFNFVGKLELLRKQKQAENQAENQAQNKNINQDINMKTPVNIIESLDFYTQTANTDCLPDFLLNLFLNFSKNQSAVNDFISDDKYVIMLNSFNAVQNFLQEFELQLAKKLDLKFKFKFNFNFNFKLYFKDNLDLINNSFEFYVMNKASIELLYEFGFTRVKRISSLKEINK